MVKYHNAATCIFAVAIRKGTASTSFTIAGMSDSAQIEVLDENRTIPPIDGTFKYDFDGYGVHLFKVNVKRRFGEYDREY